MDRPREVSLFGGSVLPSPTPPLALSDLLAQRPFPPYTPTYERPVTSPETTFGLADEQSVLVVASGDGTQASPGQDRQEIPVPDTTSEVQSTPPTQPSADPTDWLAKRNQLRPSKNQGSKGDWIRGWSEGVGVYGVETYCACSESSLVGDQSLVVKGGEIKSGARSIWLKGKRPLPIPVNSGTLSTPSASEADICRYCSRMPSPPMSTAGSVKDEAEVSHQKVSFTQKLNSFLQRAKPRRGQDTYKKYLVDKKGQSPLVAPLNRNARSEAAVNMPHGFTDSSQRKSQPRGPKNTQTPSLGETLPVPPNGLAAKPSSRPTSPIANSTNPVRAASATEKPNGINSVPAPPVITATLAAGGSSAASLSSSDNPRGDDAIAKSMSRLHRAQALLDRAGNKQDE